MRLTFDPAKRARTLAERGLDFEDAAIVFARTTVEFEDRRKTAASLESSATDCWPAASW